MKKPQTHHTLCTKKSLPASLATFQLLIHHTCKKLSSFVLSLRSNSYSFLQVLRISSFSLACLCCSSFHFCWAIQNVFSVSSTFCCSFSFNAIVYRKERKQVALQSMFKKKKPHNDHQFFCGLWYPVGHWSINTSSTGQQYLHHKETIKIGAPVAYFTQEHRMLQRFL